jgi:hypothetical protein
MFRRLVNDAVRRDPAALKLLFPLIDRYAASPETELRLGEGGRVMNRMLDLSDLSHLQKRGLPDGQVDGVSARRNRYCNWRVVVIKLPNCGSGA